MERFEMTLLTRSALLVVMAAMLSICLLGACSSRFQEPIRKRVTIEIHDPKTGMVNLDRAFQTAQEHVRSEMPNAYFTGMVFSGRCQELLDLEGKIVFTFLEVDRGFPRRQVLEGVASINAIDNTMNLRFTNETDYYPLLDRNEFVGDEGFRVLSKQIYGNLPGPSDQSCEVTISQMLPHEWVVRCGGLGDFIHRCSFAVVDGKIEIDYP